jgi:hypothetical protein
VGQQEVLNVWAHDYFEGDEAFMEDTMITSCAVIQLLGSDTKTSWESKRLTLPCSKSSIGLQIWNSGGEDYRAMPCLVKPATPALENRLVCALIAELRTKLALDLDPMPSLDRKMGSQARPKKKVEYLIVGSSNAKRTARALEDMGNDTHLIFSLNWRITRENVENLASRVSCAIAETDPDVVVLQLLDGSCYFAKGEDGSRTLPRKHADGKYHIVGEMVVCPAEIQTEQFNCMRPLFDVVGKRLCVVVSPMPRYVTEGCCNNPHHVSNREDPHFKSNLLLQLEGLKRALKNFFFNTRRRNFRLSDTAADMRGLDDSDIWFVDPVHPVNSVYTRIAEGIKQIVANYECNLDSRGGGAGSGGGRGGGGGGGRGGGGGGGGGGCGGGGGRGGRGSMGGGGRGSGTVRGGGSRGGLTGRGGGRGYGGWTGTHGSSTRGGNHNSGGASFSYQHGGNEWAPRGRGGKRRREDYEDQDDLQPRGR